MSLTAGTRVGPYEILSSLGAGGMGEVYRAKDSKLKREVALKVLPADVANDRERMARFQREAEVLASLNHPHIAQIYGLENNALVMELVEGEDLAERLKRGAIPIDEALPIAKQIAEALEAAHEQGIIHRDLKPANVKVRPDGTVKVLDFGLAKAMDAVPGGRDFGPADPLANSPTITSPAMTMRGMILGTAAYMAPEQAKGKAVDKRADIWAFGVVLFEMLTGAPAFAGDSVSDILAEVIKSEPGWSALPAQTPPAVRRLLRRCLAKDPRQRIGDAATARLEIADALSGAGAESPVSPPASRRRERLAWASAVAMAVVAAGVILAPRLRTMPVALVPPPEVRFQIDRALSAGMLSPDGTRVGYRGWDGQQSQFLIRSLASGETKSLPLVSDISGAVSSFWSPDGRSIGFFAGQKLRRIDVESGALQTLADAPTSRGGSWNSDGTILFAPAGNSALYRLPAVGGTPEKVTELVAPEASHRFPQFLPDGRHFVYWVIGPRGIRGTYLGSLEGGRGSFLLDADGPTTFAAPDQVLFIREGVLYTQRLDINAFKMTGEAVTLASGLSTNTTTGWNVTASHTGVIAFRPVADDWQQVQWVDRSGKLLQKIGEPLNHLGEAALSPDGRTIAVGQITHGLSHLWMMEVARGTLTRITSDANRPKWSPDGTRLAFTSGQQDGLLQVYWQRVGDSDAPQLLLKSSEAQNLLDWSSDGQHLLFSSQSPTSARDLWSVRIDGNNRTATPFVRTPAEERAGAFSPDGKWVAYESDETGAGEIFVRAFPGPDLAWRVSTAGGTNPSWRRDGRELYFMSGGQVMAVGVEATAGALKLGAPARLFAMRGSVIAAPDGRRFLVTAGVGDLPTPPLTIIVNSAALRSGQ